MLYVDEEMQVEPILAVGFLYPVLEQESVAPYGGDSPVCPLSYSSKVCVHAEAITTNIMKVTAECPVLRDMLLQKALLKRWLCLKQNRQMAKDYVSAVHLVFHAPDRSVNLEGELHLGNPFGGLVAKCSIAVNMDDGTRSLNKGELLALVQLSNFRPHAAGRRNSN